MSITNKGRDIERRIPCPDYLSSFFGAAAARQRLDAIYLFARLLIEGCVAEVDVPVQGRVRVVLVVISLISGSSVALLVTKDPWGGKEYGGSCSRRLPLCSVCVGHI